MLPGLFLFVAARDTFRSGLVSSQPKAIRPNLMPALHPGGCLGLLWSGFDLYVVSAFRRTVVVRLKPDTTYK